MSDTKHFEEASMPEKPTYKELEQRIRDLEQDALKHRDAEKALGQSQQRFESLIEKNADAIIVISIDGFVRFINRAAESLLGLQFKDLVDQSFGFPVVVGESTELEVMTKDGDTRTVEMRVVETEWQGEKANLASLRDITARKQLEAQLRQSQKMEAIGTLAGGVAHDFNNLLTTIIGNADICLIQLDKDNPLREDVGEIKKAGERASALTRQLLAFSRKQVLHPQVLDLNDVISDMEKMLGRMIGEDLEVKSILESELGKIKIDPSQIEQVLMNLAVNARDAMPQGGKLTIKTSSVHLDRNFFQSQGLGNTAGPYVLLSVSDNGTGMSQKTKSQIFDPFFTTKQQGKGTGLGLSMVYGIVMQSDGYIWVDSEVGQGTTFKIFLPTEVEPDIGAESFETAMVTATGSETVLVVEDDTMLRNLSQKILNNCGYEVFVASHGKEALELCREQGGAFHLMLTDVVMPGMSGRELAERVQPLYPKIKVLYMSGYTDDTTVRHGIVDRRINFIEKPFTPESLAVKVREVLDAKEQILDTGYERTDT